MVVSGTCGVAPLTALPWFSNILEDGDKMLLTFSIACHTSQQMKMEDQMAESSRRTGVAVYQ